MATNIVDVQVIYKKPFRQQKKKEGIDDQGLATRKELVLPGEIGRGKDAI